jgi:hypothetical protein
MLLLKFIVATPTAATIAIILAIIFRFIITKKLN